jgi:hypothetical protein
VVERYYSLKLSIQELSKDQFRSRIDASPVNASPGQGHDFTLTKEELARWTSPNIDNRTTRNTLVDLGKELFERTIDKEVLHTYGASVRLAQTDNVTLRICLNILTPRLIRVPWEYSYYGNSFLLAEQQSIVRIIEPDNAAAFHGPIKKLLIAVANPTKDRGDFQPAQHLDQLRKNINGAFDYEILEVSSERTLGDKLESGNFDSFYFIGHGDFDEHKEGSLVLDSNGYAQYLNATKLAEWARNGRIQFAYLNACSGAQTGISNAYTGVVHRMKSTGRVGCVIGMQAPIGHKVAFAIAESFFRYLAKSKCSFEEALSRSRHASEHPAPEWGLPVIYTSYASPAEHSKVSSTADESVDIAKQESAVSAQSGTSSGPTHIPHHDTKTTARSDQRETAIGTNRTSPSAPRDSVSVNELIRLRDYAANGGMQWENFCNYCIQLAHLRDIASELPFAATLLLADLDDHATAEAYMTLDPHPEDRCWLWMDLADVYSKRGDATKAGELLQQAVREVHDAKPEKAGLSRIEALVTQLSAAGEMGTAKELARKCHSLATKMKSTYERGEALIPAVTALVTADDRETAKNIIFAEHETINFADLVAHLAVELAKKSRFDELVANFYAIQE